MADSYFSNVSVLIPADGATGTNDTTTTIVDVSNSAHTITKSGGTALTTTNSRADWGNSSILFNGTDAYANVSSGTDLAFGTGNGTIEFWVWTDPAVGAYARALENATHDSSTRGWHFNYNGADSAGSRRLGFQMSNPGGGGTAIYSNAALPTSQWVYVAVTIQGGSVATLYVNGTAQTSTMSLTGISFDAQTLRIGATLGTAANFYTGQVDDIRITKGLIRTITTPTIAFPTTGDPPSLQPEIAYNKADISTAVLPIHHLYL